jgi:putative (di)nucleoside polyphosphate hydrolase
MSGGAPGGGLPYRPCVGVMLLDARGRVFMGRRSNMETDAWQMPQGGIDDGEAPATAALRELDEETGTRDAEILAETRDWLTYDLPDHLIGKAFGGRFRGQRQKWFALRFRGVDADIRLDAHHPEFDAWRWVGIDDVAELVVDFKRPVYRAVVAEFHHLAVKQW